ncbi:fimbria/pilus periplasmic chaperone [Rahnella sikkimica]|uniref:Uncharacterized protein n=1 Tax=Rahnella sikkimica TaxID=1805933 RepID=A0A2L1UTW8_9GAMM|nr:fimbria/pilus periplasmic chaperone [Rahnella sikkimica]AVF36314.1 hypothetical protein BV494_15860 [Rahnella sikkimica]
MNILNQAVMATLFISISTPAWSNIDVSPMSAIVTPQGVTLITVTSKAEGIRYIQTGLKQVLNPATKQEKESEESISNSEGVIVSPSKFVLAAGQKHNIRLVTMNLPATEKVYRLYIESLPAKEGEARVDTEKLKTEVGIDLVWGVVIHVPPSKPLIRLSLDSAANQITNEGNFHLKISRIGFCTDSNKDETCDWANVNKNLYPSQKLDIPKNKKTGKIKIDYFNEYENASAKLVLN